MITFSDFKINLKKKWKSVVFLTNLALFLGLGLSLVEPFLYKTNFSVLIVQDTKQSNDVYSSIESSDKLAALLVRIVKTSDFQNSVMSSDFNISKDDFSSDEATKRKQWNKMVKTSVVPGTGIINFDIYYKNKSGAEEYAKAVVHSIVNDGPQIYGGSNLITFRIINSPLTTNKPATPNIILNGILSLVVGLFASIFYVYFTTTEIKKRDVFYDEDAENENIDKNYSSNPDISVLPNSKINSIKEEVIEKESINVEVKEENNIKHFEQVKVDDLIKEEKEEKKENDKIIDDSKNDAKKVDDIKIIYEEDSVPNLGFLKNVNDRVKSVINKDDI